MARKNRVVQADRLYHITTRIAHRARLLSDAKIKDRIVTWIYGIADFCGIEVLAWCVMDNHLHLFVRMPDVPECFRTQGDIRPPTAAFSMRPAECRAPRWTPDITDARPEITPVGDVASDAAILKSVGDGVPLVCLPRPAAGFSIPDDELFRRLGRLYAGYSRGAERIRRRWERLRQCGLAEEVEREREAFCRRMYNISQFMKTLKQRISECFNRELDHSGQLWEGRFWSGLVDDDYRGRVGLTSYVMCNPIRAGMVSDAADYAWCSYGAACGKGPFAERAREGLCAVLGCGWDQARDTMAAIVADELPEAYDVGSGGTHYRVTDENGRERLVPLRFSQIVKKHVKAFSRGGYVSVRHSFAADVRARLPKGFDAPGTGSIDFLARLDWTLPMRRTA